MYCFSIHRRTRRIAEGRIARVASTRPRCFFGPRTFPTLDRSGATRDPESQVPNVERRSGAPQDCRPMRCPPGELRPCATSDGPPQAERRPARPHPAESHPYTRADRQGGRRQVAEGDRDRPRRGDVPVLADARGEGAVGGAGDPRGVDRRGASRGGLAALPPASGTCTHRTAHARRERPRNSARHRPPAASSPRRWRCGPIRWLMICVIATPVGLMTGSSAGSLTSNVSTSTRSWHPGQSTTAGFA